MKALEIIFLVSIVTTWALWNDRNGDNHKGWNDVFWESFIIMISSAIVSLVDSDWHAYLKSVTIAVTGFGLFFPYLFNWMWFNKYTGTYRRLSDRLYYVFNHLSDKAWPDRWPLWRKVGWLGRLFIYTVLFVLAILWFLN